LNELKHIYKDKTTNESNLQFVNGLRRADVFTGNNSQMGMSHIGSHIGVESKM
jgi:hypothetical protein